MKKLFFLSIIQFALLISISAQTDQSHKSLDALTRLKNSGNGFDDLKIRMDPGIEENYYKHLGYNKNNPNVLGLRIRIYRGSGTGAFDEASRVRANFTSKYDDVSAYLKFDTPDFVVYVGDCRTWSEALKLFYRIEKDYPFSYVVPQQPINTTYNKDF